MGFFPLLPETYSVRVYSLRIYSILCSNLIACIRCMLTYIIITGILNFTFQSNLYKEQKKKEEYELTIWAVSQ